MASTPFEPRVKDRSPMPEGYRFVPKSDVHITHHVRKRAHATGALLFVVFNRNNKVVGIRCPTPIFEAAAEASAASAQGGSTSTRGRHTAAKRKSKAAILEYYPRIPERDMRKITKHVLRKGSEKIEKADAAEMEREVRSAVRSRIRHKYTQYKRNINFGELRGKAWEVIDKETDSVADSWDGIEKCWNPLEKGMREVTNAVTAITVMRAINRCGVTSEMTRVLATTLRDGNRELLSADSTPGRAASGYGDSPGSFEESVEIKRE